MYDKESSILQGLRLDYLWEMFGYELQGIPTWLHIVPWVDKRIEVPSMDTHVGRDTQIGTSLVYLWELTYDRRNTYYE